MNFKPVNALEESLMKAATEAAHRPQFYRDLLNADVFVLQNKPADSALGKKTLEADTTIDLVSFERDGKAYLPFFSSLPRLQANIQEEMGYMVLKARDFLSITKGTFLVLNPGSDYGKEFTAEEVDSMLDGSIFSADEKTIVEKSTEVMIGHPSNYPQELADALATLFKSQPEVKRAYLAHYINPTQSKAGHTLIAIECSDSWDKILGDAGVIVRNVKIPDPPVDFLRLTGDGGLDSYFDSTKPFYKKKKLFGIF